VEKAEKRRATEVRVVRAETEEDIAEE